MTDFSHHRAPGFYEIFVVLKHRWSDVATVVVLIIAVAVFFCPPPSGATPTAMHAAALILLTIGLWALGSIPEHVTAMLFFLLAMVLAIAKPQVVFSAFTSSAIWLVFGGLFIAHAVGTTGLGKRFAGVLFDRYTSSYGALLVAVAVAATLLSFFMPATVGRMLLLVPIVVALAERVGFERGSNGYHGLVLTALIISFQSGTGILPANTPNLVLAGASEALYGVHVIYAEWLWVMFPVLVALKGAILVWLVWRLYPATVQTARAATANAAMSTAERRLAFILALALLLWTTDFMHGLRAGWVALAAAVVCLVPRIGVLSATAFNEVRFGPFFYIGATIGLGAMAQESGLGNMLGELLRSTFALHAGADFANFLTLSTLATFVGVLATNAAQPALLAPLAGQFAEATGWPINAVLMTMAVGFNIMLMPYQVPPLVVGMQVGGVSLRAALRVTLPLAAVSFLLLPVEYLWWRMIGYFG